MSAMPLEFFYSYSHKDSALREELQVHLAQLTRDGLIAGWADRCLLPGDEWRVQIDEHIRSAHIIVLLVSPDFLASDYCFGVELKIAMERHTAKQAVVIPIILRSADWHSTPFAALQALPQDGRAVTLWPNRDEVMAQIAQSIRELAVRFQEPAPKPEFSPFFDRQIPAERVLDAAMPSHIVIGKAAELQAMIRLPHSPGLAGVLQLDDEAEARPEDVRSKPFEVTFPFGALGEPQPLKVAVQVTSPDFSPASQMKNIFVPVNGDSPVCGFLLTPTRTGSLLVMIELTWEDAERGYRRLKTNCVSESAMPERAPMTLVQMEVGVGMRKAGRGAVPPPMAAAAGVGDPFELGKNWVPPKLRRPDIAERIRPVDLPAPLPPERKAGFLASPLVKVAAVACVLLLGSTFFWLQKPSRGTISMPSTAPQIPAALEQRVQAAAVDLEQAGTQPEKPPAVAAAIEEGQRNLKAARMALQKGDRVEARRRLAAVEALNRQLSQRAKPPH